MHNVRHSLGACAVLVVVGCSQDLIPPSDPLPEVISATIEANSTMVVAATVRVSGFGDSVRVAFHLEGATGSDSVSAPVMLPLNGAVDVPVLGLLPQASYLMRAVVFFRGDSAVSGSLAVTTGALPPDLPAYATSGSAPTPGYFVFSAGNYGLVIDHTGRVVWYRRFPPAGPGLNFMAQFNGRYVGRVLTPDTTDDDPMVEYAVTGAAQRELRCLNGRRLRFHDLLVAADGSYWIMCDDTRTMDLSARGGSATARVTATTVQHIGAAGLLFEWNAFDHFLITDIDSAQAIGVNVNFTHGNAIDLDADGNLLVSFRSLNEVTKVNTTTGAVIWRMGGRRNQFTFTGPGSPGFQGQHNVRAAGAGRMILLDNTGSADSRYERYAVDVVTMTATLEQWYSSSVQTLIGGSVQQSGAGRFLVSFGTQGRVEEFDQSGATLWRISGNPGYVFRAQRINSLYHAVPAHTR